MLAEEVLLAAPLGHSMSSLSSSLLPPSHQQLPPSHPSGLNKTRTELHDIPTKKGKPLDDASAYPLDYQRYHTLMYAHCAQQQHVGQMSAFRPWAPPKSFLHAYNAAAVAALCMSQEPPILQNPERVVRNTDRERFERTYQPNVALAPRKNITAKEMDRERERERIEREREREIERARERERSRERERQRERETEKERDRELQQLQQHTQRHEGFGNLRDTDMQIQIKQERASTPCNMSPVTPPLPSMQVLSQMDEQHLNPLHRRIIGPMSNDDETQPLSLSLYPQKRHIHPPPPQQHPLALKSSSNGALELLQHRRSSMQTSSSSTCSTSSSVSSISPPECHQQQQLLGFYHNFHQQQQQQQQQMLQTQQPRQSPPAISPPNLSKINNNIYSPSQQQQNNNHLSRSQEELSSSNEISSSTSPLPVTSSTHNIEDKPLQQQQQQQTQHQYLNQHQYETQTIINTVNQHAKLLPTITTNAVTSNNNNNNKQYDEISNSRIRINKNLMHSTNIMRSPTPPLKPSKSPVAVQVIQQQQQQKQYEYNNNKQQQQQQKQACYVNFTQPQQQQQSQLPLAAGLNLSTNKKNHAINNNYMNKFHHNGTRSNYHHLHMGSGEFELSTDTDDESVNGEPDSSINVLPPWEMAVEALRETKPKERERVLHLLQRLLHDNQQYRYTNLKLNELLQKRETQIRELSEQMQHYRLLLEQQQQQQKQQDNQQIQLREQEQPENLKSRVREDKELCVPLKKSLRREPELLLLERCSPPRINNLIETKRRIKEETTENDMEIVERKKTKSEEISNNENVEKVEEAEILNETKLETNKTKLEVQPTEVDGEKDKVQTVQDSNKIIENEQSPPVNSAKDSNLQAEKIESDTDSENENENDSDKSNQSTVTKRVKNSIVTAPANAKDGLKEEVDLDNEIKNNVLLKENHKKAAVQVQKTDISLCTKENISLETDGSDINNDDEEDDDDDVVMHDSENVDKNNKDAAVLLLTSSASTASTDLPEQTCDNSDSNESVGIKEAQITAMEKSTDVNENNVKKENEANIADNVNVVLLTAKTIPKDALCKTEEKAEKRNKETTYMLAKKKKKKKERKERKERRRAAAALALATAAVATTKDIDATSTFKGVSHNGLVTGSTMRPPLVTKASKKQTPMTTNELQQQQQQTIKQE